MRIAGIDQGTTSTRILTVDAAGNVNLALALPHAQTHPRPGWVEQDPEELLRTIRACVAAGGPLDAVGIDNQGESCLAWDAATGEAFTPVVACQDSRTEADIARLRAEGAEELTLARAGLLLDTYLPGPSWAVCCAIRRRPVPRANAAPCGWAQRPPSFTTDLVEGS